MGSLFLVMGDFVNKKIKITIDKAVIEKYELYYFSIYPRRTKPPIPRPYHESINEWMILRRPAMNALKQRWKDFIKWVVYEQGYSNLHISKCELTQKVYYANNRRHDIDNSVPKFILDGLVESGMLLDDDSKHISKLILECGVDTERPRTELHFKILD